MIPIYLKIDAVSHPSSFNSLSSLSSIFTLYCADIKNFLVFARQLDIRRISLDTPSHVDTVIPLAAVRNTLDVDGHAGTDYIYWSDIASNTVNRARWDGSGQEVSVATGQMESYDRDME